MRITPGMFTRFYDALVLAAKEQYGSSTSRRAVIVFTDGIDSGRGSTFEAALRAALQSQTTVYVVSNTEIERARKQEELNALLSGTDSAVKFNQLRIEDLRMGLAALPDSERNLECLENSSAEFGGVESTLYLTTLNK